MNHGPTSSRRSSSTVIILSLSALFGSGLLACTGEITEPSAAAGGESMSTPDAGPTDPSGGSSTGDKVSLSFEESTEELANPERGFYTGIDLLDTSAAAHVRASGHTLAIALVRLDAYRDADLDAAFLAKLTAGFAAARSAGIKVVLRFTYNSSATADASRARILGHIAQLKPVLQANADVIAVMQAGFIGAWGEWHSSTNGLDNDADRGAILNAILDALPASRMVQVRTPMYKASIYGASALSEANAFDGSHRARVGHHNDCFLASESDMGTYASPVPTWEAFTAADTKYVPMGGETCAVSSRTEDAMVALAEMEQHHWSYLNQEYQKDVLASWDAAGVTPEVRRRLGYRFSLVKAEHDKVVAPGGVLSVALEIKNSGYAAPYNARPVFLVVEGGGARRTVQLPGVDVRRWQPGQVTKLNARLRLPADLIAGSYKLSLWIPDEAASLRSDPRYAVRLANERVWNDATGDNLVSEQVTVDPAAPSAPGSVDASADVLAVLP
jgi:hypothetical protein